MEGPTMSLEEFADLEVARALERERSAKENPRVEVRRFKQLQADGDDDDIDLLDQVLITRNNLSLVT